MSRSAQMASPHCVILRLPLRVKAPGSVGSCGWWAGAGPDPLAGLCQEMPRADLALGKAGTTESLGPSHSHL